MAGGVGAAEVLVLATGVTGALVVTGGAGAAVVVPPAGSLLPLDEFWHPAMAHATIMARAGT